MNATEPTARDLVNKERTHRLTLAQEQRAYVDARNRELRDCCQARWDATGETTKRLADRIVDFQSRTLWGRLWWLVTGR